MNYKEVLKKKGYYLIAEIGVNYYDIATEKNISIMEAAKLMIDEAKRAGIDAVKFQSYKAGKIASRFSPAYWDTNEEPTTSQYELFSKFDLFGQKEYQELADYCKEIDIDFLSTPFDFDSADYLDNMMDIYKISSSDLTNIPFITHIAKKNKPILLSTGASEAEEIDDALNAIYSTGNRDVTMMHCILEYPAPYEHSNLKRIRTLKARYPELTAGYSDHTKPTESMDVVKTAWLMGAEIIEKHFTLDKTLKGNDHYHAMDTEDAIRIIEGLEFIKRALGEGSLDYLESEKPARLNARRSIVAACDIQSGQKITREMLDFKRPGHGISPKYIDKVLGSTAAEDIKCDTAIQKNMLAESEEKGL